MAHEGHDHDGDHSHSHSHSHDHGHGAHHHGPGHIHDHSHAAHEHPHSHAKDPGLAHEPPHAEPQPSAVQEHKSHAPAHVAAFVLTCSDTRDPAHDRSGPVIRRALEAEGHSLVGYRLVHDEPAEIRSALEAAAQAGARAVVITGGTGVSRRDVTVETVEALFEKRLPGFGELFRALSFQQIGSSAWLSRATAGTWQGMVVFAVPGSPQACELAMRKLILPELGHVVRELSR